MASKTDRQRVWLAGHSLGGALATLAAAHLDAQMISGVVTFGCPRVGDAPFVACLPEPKMVRYVHRDDWVATVPPEILGFRHAGVQKAVEGDGVRNLASDFLLGLNELQGALTTLAKTFRFSTGDLPFKVPMLADHAPVYYASLLWNAVLASASADD